MMKEITIEVFDCKSCPKYFESISLGRICEISDKVAHVIPDINTIPAWCPLSDKED